MNIKTEVFIATTTSRLESVQRVLEKARLHLLKEEKIYNVISISHSVDTNRRGKHSLYIDARLTLIYSVQEL